MTTATRMGVCYFPEHWPEERWAEDISMMVDAGLTQVRIGEFAWARIEPSPGQFDWGWLDRAIEALGAVGLHVMLCTPTATSPKWLIDAHPEVLAYDVEGRPRRFGSRRHYCFSSPVYRDEAQRITRAVAERYGQHPAVTAWQTDNEYGCHDTVRSYSPAAAAAFRSWLVDRYGNITALNDAWGTVFWSQAYRSFEEIDLPNLTVTEPNPSHLLDFYRFSSDQVISFNRLQVDILRKLSPGRDITHNAMGFFTDFDHFRLVADLDAIGWDSYPLGFLDMGPFPEEDKRRYRRQGHPDIAAFHHDLYRACGQGRWLVHEQQPGPVNWANHNPAPLPGMLRLWALEAAAHGAESVMAFRWRQAPFAQEQMHAGLLRPDGAPAQGLREMKEAAAANLVPAPAPADAVLVFDYEAAWAFEALPHGTSWSYRELVFTWYSALRRLGATVDIQPPDGPWEEAPFVVIPSLPILTEGVIERLKARKGPTLMGPRTGSMTRSLQIPPNLAPGLLQDLLPLKVVAVESSPRDETVPGLWDGAPANGHIWREHVETDLPPVVASPNGSGLLYREEALSYLTTVPGPAFLGQLMADGLAAAGCSVTPLPPDLRVRRFGDATLAVNYGPEPLALSDEVCPPDATFALGDRALPPAGVAVWRTTDHQQEEG